MSEEIELYANRLRGEAESCAADCCLDFMDDDEKRDSIHDMLLDFCGMRNVPDEMIGSVAARLLQMICGN